ncbi:hypothetical protein BHE74_00032371 [Ensete ventricosum]|nr:hypothetical protein BHE74_00032371 [Ensete ventricosum]RZS12251.1 hypothetical protein BHM03_00043671 [Ensete ventricosum]
MLSSVGRSESRLLLHGRQSRSHHGLGSSNAGKKAESTRQEMAQFVYEPQRPRLTSPPKSTIVRSSSRLTTQRPPSQPD